MRYCASFAVTDSSTPTVLIISDPADAEAVSSRLSGFGRPIDVIVSDGGPATVEMFLARTPAVVVIGASLKATDAKAMLATLRALVAHGPVGTVLVGDEDGPIRTASDAIEFAADRFVARPLAADALCVAVGEVLEVVERRKRGDVLADPDDAAVEVDSVKDDQEPLPLPPLFEIRPRRDLQPIAEFPAWAGDPPQVVARSRESMLIIRAPDPDPPVAPPAVPESRLRSPTSPPPIPAIRSRGPSSAPYRGIVSTQTTTSVEDEWSAPTPLSEVVERVERSAMSDELPSVDALDGFDVDARITSARPMYDVGEFDDPDLIVPTPIPSLAVQDEPGTGQDFARQLRAKMSLMAQRLFHGETGAPERADGELRGADSSDHDLAALGAGASLGGVGVTAIARVNVERRERTSSVSSFPPWNIQVRDRDILDSGELVRGVSDVAIVLAKLFARTTTGRVSFRQDDIEKVVFLDAGRPVFASSNAPGDRMGELLVREGKITAAQYDRCQTDVTRSGRRIGEILVDFGYLKRRELLPAVRRHVEDIVFSLFGWTSGHYEVASEAAASGERIRMSRHPAALILEGIRRKLDRSTLEHLVGPPSTIIDIASRDRLSTIVNASDLAEEERAALAALDGRSDLAAVARAAGVDIADVLPLAWGLCVLELATTRRVEPEDSSAGVVGETDLAIDRERIRARWDLVVEADYFALLGVRRDATGFEIRRAYQSARRDFAPESFALDLRRELARELADITTVLDEAFRVMRDDNLRVKYLSALPN